MTYRSVLVTLRANADQFNREMRRAGSTIRDLNNDIDHTNDRTAWLTQGLLALGPTFVPLGAAIVPVLAGIAAQATVGAAAVGTMALAFNGVGDALKAVNKAQLDPTAENLEKMHQALAKLGPDGAEFVRFLDDVGGKLSVLAMDARGGMFPGMTEGIESLLKLLPKVRSIVTEISEGIGQLSSEAGAGLAGPEFRDFFNYLRDDGKDILVDMGRTFGNFVDGFASMIVAFGPLTHDFSDGLLGMSRDFEKWSEGLGENDSFQDFLAYIDQSGPKALDLLGSLSDLFVELARAAAPVGDAVLPALTKIIDVIASIADTPLGSFTIIGLALTSLVGRFRALGTIAGGPIFKPFVTNIKTAASASGVAAKQISTNMKVIGESYKLAGTQGALLAASAGKLGKETGGLARKIAPIAGQVGLLALAMSPLPEKLGLTSTTMGAMVGSAIGPWGTAVGAATGFVFDMVGANQEWEASIKSVDDAIASQDLGIMQKKLAELKEELNFREEDVDWSDLGNVFSHISQAAADTFSGDWFGTEHQEETASAIEKLEHAMGTAAGAARGYADVVHDVGLAGLEATHGIDALIAAIDRQQAQARAALDATYAWGQAVINLRDRVDEGKDGFNEFTKAGQENYSLLKAGADSFNEAAPDEQTVGRYNKVRDSLIAFAKELGAGNKLANTLVDSLLNVPEKLSTDYAIRYDKAQLQQAVDAFRSLPPKVQTDIRANGIPQTKHEIDGLVAKYHLTEQDREALVLLKGNAIERVQILLGLLKDADGFHANSTITLTRETVYTQKGNPPNLHGNDPLGLNQLGGSAEGGTVPGARLPYGDKVLRWLAPGEQVIGNRYGQADRFRADTAAGRIPGYAEGGTVGLPINTRSYGVDAVAREATSALKQLAAAARAAGGGALTGSFGPWLHSLAGQLAIATERLKQANKKLRDMEKALDRQNKAIEKQEQVVADAFSAIEDVLSQMEDMRQGIVDKLSKGLFDGVDENTGVDLFSQVLNNLTGNRDAGRSWLDSLTQLQGLGLDGPALQALLEQATAEQLAEFANLTEEQIQQFEDLFGDSTSATGGAGALSAQLVFSEQLAFARESWAEEKEELKAAREQRREMIHAINEQTKLVDKLEKVQQKLKEKVDKIEESHPRRNGRAFKDAMDGVAGDGVRNRS